MTFSKDTQLDFRLRNDEKALALFLMKEKLTIAKEYFESFESVDRALNIAINVISNSGILKERKEIDRKVLFDHMIRVLANSFDDARLRFYFLEGYGPISEIVSSPSEAIEKQDPRDGGKLFFNLRVAYTFPVAKTLSVEYLFCDGETNGKRLLGYTLSEFVNLIKQVKD